MAEQIHVAGAAHIRVGTGTGGALEDLGYTRNGAEPDFEAFHLNVPGDEHGGDDGPPIDVQILGEIARVRLELTKFDSTIAGKVASRVLGGTEGFPATPGTLLLTGGKYIRLLLHTTNNPINFPWAIVRGVNSINKATKFSTAVFEFECHKVTDPLHSKYGKLYDTDTT